MPKLQVIEDGRKQCGSCDEWFDVESFGKRPNGSYKTYCVDCKTEMDREYYERTKDDAKDRFLVRTYGISTRDVERMKVAQDYKCATCGDEESGRGLFVDHDHETGEVRGLLCHNCNSSLGLVKDNIDTLKAMIEYLEKE